MSIQDTERKPQTRRKMTSPPGKSAASTSKQGSSSAKRRVSASPRPQRREAPVNRKPRRTEPAPKPAHGAEPVPEVVYLPPQPFNRKRLLLRLATVAAIVLALLMGISVFFKVDDQKILVSGNSKYTAWDVFQASGIQDNENLLTFSRARAAAKVRAALPYVESIRIGIKLPDTVIIEVVEVEVPYAVAASDGTWWLISSGGKVIEKLPDGGQSGYTRILGVQLQSPVSGEQAAAAEPAPGQTDPEGNTVASVTTQAQRLKTALNIAQYLELNGIIGDAATLDVNDLADIQVMYGQQYQVKLGNDTQLSYKISCMKHAIDRLDDYQSGVLDISFTTWPDKVGFTPFDDDSVSFYEIT